MKFIFLDIDGVLVTNVPGVFDDHLAMNLKSVVDATGARIVLSSDWRRQRCHEEYCRLCLQRYGLDFVGSTPSYSGDVAQRPNEILQWKKEYLRTNPIVRISAWVAIDDRNLLEEQNGDKIQGHFVNTDPAVGLDRAAADACIQLLNEQPADGLESPTSPISPKSCVWTTNSAISNASTDTSTTTSNATTPMNMSASMGSLHSFPQTPQAAIPSESSLLTRTPLCASLRSLSSSTRTSPAQQPSVPQTSPAASREKEEMFKKIDERMEAYKKMMAKEKEKMANENDRKMGKAQNELQSVREDDHNFFHQPPPLSPMKSLAHALLEERTPLPSVLQLTPPPSQSCTQRPPPLDHYVDELEQSLRQSPPVPSPSYPQTPSASLTSFAQTPTELTQSYPKTPSASLTSFAQTPTELTQSRTSESVKPVGQSEMMQNAYNRAVNLRKKLELEMYGNAISPNPQYLQLFQERLDHNLNEYTRMPRASPRPLIGMTSTPVTPTYPQTPSAPVTSTPLTPTQSYRDQTAPPTPVQPFRDVQTAPPTPVQPFRDVQTAPPTPVQFFRDLQTPQTPVQSFRDVIAKPVKYRDQTTAELTLSTYPTLGHRIQNSRYPPAELTRTLSYPRTPPTSSPAFQQTPSAPMKSFAQTPTEIAQPVPRTSPAHSQPFVNVPPSLEQSFRDLVNASSKYQKFPEEFSSEERMSLQPSEETYKECKKNLFGASFKFL